MEKNGAFKSGVRGSSPVLPEGCGAAEAEPTTGACVAHTKARFVAMTRVKFREFRSATARRDPLFHFHRNLLGKTVLDEIARRRRHALVRPGQRNRFVVVRLELADLLALLE